LGLIAEAQGSELFRVMKEKTMAMASYKRKKNGILVRGGKKETTTDNHVTKNAKESPRQCVEKLGGHHAESGDQHPKWKRKKG